MLLRMVFYLPWFKYFKLYLFANNSKGYSQDRILSFNLKKTPNLLFLLIFFIITFNYTHASRRSV